MFYYVNSWTKLNDCYVVFYAFIQCYSHEKLHLFIYFVLFLTAIWMCYWTIKGILGSCESLCLLPEFFLGKKLSFRFFFIGLLLLLWDRCGSFWDCFGIVMDHCGIVVGSLWVVPGFSNYDVRIPITHQWFEINELNKGIETIVSLIHYWADSWNLWCET